jgi:hypothetical protein
LTEIDTACVNRLNRLAQRGEGIILNIRFSGVCRHSKRCHAKRKDGTRRGELCQLPNAFKADEVS